jgi:hypothetical protein
LSDDARHRPYYEYRDCQDGNLHPHDPGTSGPAVAACLRCQFPN